MSLYPVQDVNETVQQEIQTICIKISHENRCETKLHTERRILIRR